LVGGKRGRKRRLAAAAGDDTEGSSGKNTERAGGGGDSRGRGVRAPRGAAQVGRGVIQEITTDGLVEAAAEATGTVAAPAMISVSLWQHTKMRVKPVPKRWGRAEDNTEDEEVTEDEEECELPIEDEGSDDNVGRGDDDDGDGGDNDGVEATPPKPSPHSADRPPFPESTMNPDLDTKLEMSSDNTIGD